MAAKICSMTGFARQEGSDDLASWSWEIKSVNGRNLDQRVRVPGGYEDLEGRVRSALPKHFARGNFQVNLTVNHTAAPVKIAINQDVLAQLGAIIGDLEGEFDLAAPRVDGILALKGVLETVDVEEAAESRTARLTAIAGDLDQALAALLEMRLAEGERLAGLVLARLDDITGLVEKAVHSSASQPEALRSRLERQLSEILESRPPVPEERLAQELALLATKADIREELDRLSAHIAAARDLLADGGAVGRKLDFLCQEFNREANTLCSKSSDVELTRIGLDLKAVIEQLREQVQNIE